MRVFKKAVICFILLLLCIIPLNTTIASSESNSKRGLAVAYYYPEDLAQVSWFYSWGSCNLDPKCVPMSYAGEDILLPDNYSGYLLVFNEPNNIAPYGADIDVDTAILRYKKLVDKYPNAKMIVGGVSAWDTAYYGSWLYDFKSQLEIKNLPLPYAWAVHGYVESWITKEHLLSWWTTTHNIIGGTFWITEWNDSTGNYQNDQYLSKWMDSQSWIERWAYFTNRAQGTEPWWPPDWNTQLWDTNGNPTIIAKNWWLIKSLFLPIIENP